MKNIIVIIGLVAIFISYLAYSNTDEIVVNKNQEVIGLVNKLKESAQGKSFWENQLILVKYEIEYEETFPARMAEVMQEVEKARIEFQEDMQEFHKNYPSPKPTIAQQQADALRERADDIEQKEIEDLIERTRIERIKELKVIKFVIQNVINYYEFQNK